MTLENMIQLSNSKTLLDKALPIFRGRQGRSSDIYQTILNYEPNGVKKYIQGFDESIRPEIESAFLEYVVALDEHYYHGANLYSEINDTLDKITTPIEAGMDATIVGHVPAWFLRAAQILGPAAALYGQWDSMEKSKSHFTNTYGAQKEYLTKSSLLLAAAELSELIPAIGAVIGPATDLFNLYVRNANNLIAIGVTPKSFEAYLSRYNSPLYGQIKMII